MARAFKKYVPEEDKPPEFKGPLYVAICNDIVEAQVVTTEQYGQFFANVLTTTDPWSVWKVKTNDPADAIVSVEAAVEKHQAAKS